MRLFWEPVRNIIPAIHDLIYDPGCNYHNDLLSKGTSSDLVAATARQMGKGMTMATMRDAIKKAEEFILDRDSQVDAMRFLDMSKASIKQYRDPITGRIRYDLV